MVRNLSLVGAATLAALVAAHALSLAAGGPALAHPAVAEATPAPVLASGASSDVPAGAAQVDKAADGHFWAQAEVNGRWVRFLVDTGASGVALTPQDAQRLGFDLASLDYSLPMITANGETRGAPVTLDHVAIAGARVDQVRAVVAREGLAYSLLGMSYLGRLSRFEATPTTLILRP